MNGGAFTGADQRRIGKFEQMNGGTIFLDEVVDMSRATPAKAPRLLQQQQFERVGGNVTIQTDVRVIAATNRDMAAMVESGQFRRDLFYRLNVFTIHLPQLRERLEDIPLLASNFVRQIARDLDHPPLMIMDEAIELLQKRDWPGNVQELESAMKFALAHSTGDIITPDCLPESCRHRPKAQLTTTASALPIAIVPEQSGLLQDRDKPEEQLDVKALTQKLLSTGSNNLYREIGSTVNKLILETVMQHVASNQQHAAELLGISRMTLRAKQKALNSAEHEIRDDAEPSQSGPADQKPV